MNEKNLYKAFLLLALPIFLANLLKSFHDLIDTYFIGKLENSVNAQAGVSLSVSLINIFLSFSVGLSIAGIALISQFVGAKEEENAKRYAALLLTISIILGLIIAILLYFISPVIMKLLGSSGETYEYAVIYLKIIAFEMPSVFIFSAYQTIRQAKGDYLSPVIISIVSVITNIFLTTLFVKTLTMGVIGTAYATLIGQVLVVPACFYRLFKKKNDFKLSFKNMKLVKEDAIKIVKFTTPSTLSQILASLGFLVLQGIILKYGEETATAISLGNKISNILLLPITALSSILATYVGQNIGAKNKERAKKSYKISKILTLSISIGGVLILFPIRIIVLRLLTNDAVTLEIASEYIIWVLVMQPFLGIFQNYLGVFNGSGNTMYSFILITVRFWIIRLPLILIIESLFDMNINYLGIIMNISNILSLFLGAYLYRKINYEPKIRTNVL